MHPKSSLTFKVVAFEEIEGVDPNDAIDWAIEMIELGFESRTLYVLASLEKPANFFEIVGYVKQAVKEIGLEMKVGKEAVLSYAAYYVLQIAKAINVRKNLTELYVLSQSIEYEDSIYDFYLLFWAWDDLDYEDSGNNQYWNGSTRQNIEDITINEARKWIIKNSKSYEQNN